MKKRLILVPALVASVAMCLSGCGSEEEKIVLRVSNWEEYIDEGEWDPEEDLIELENATICSETGIVEDFEVWYYETYAKR